jgi:hypothetical protein
LEEVPFLWFNMRKSKRVAIALENKKVCPLKGTFSNLKTFVPLKSYPCAMTFGSGITGKQVIRIKTESEFVNV